MKESITIIIGDPASAIHRITASRVSAKTGGGKILYPRFEIMADTEVVHGDISSVIIKSKGLTESEKLLVVEELATYSGATGASASKYLQQMQC